MTAFSRRWRWGGDELPLQRTSDIGFDPEPLDTQDQEALVKSFEIKAKLQNVLWRGVFGAFAVAFALFFLYSGRQQSISPWSLRYHAAFMNALEPRYVVLADYAEAVACTLIAVGMCSPARWHRDVLRFSMALSSMLSLLLLERLLRQPAFGWPAVALPLGTFGLAGICLYVDGALAGTAKDVQALRASIYHYKKS